MSKLHKLRNPEETYFAREQPNSSLIYARDIFAKSELTPSPDRELSSLVAQVSQYLTDTDIIKFLEVQKRFDGPATMFDTGELVEHWGLRRTLKQVPEYMQSAKAAGITYAKANQLLLHTSKSDPYEFVQQETHLSLLSRAYRKCAEYQTNLPAHLKQFKQFIGVGAKNGILEGSLYGFSIATRLGLSIPQSCQMIMRLPEADGSASGYSIGHFNDALKTMLPAKVNPELVVKTFEQLGGERPWFQLGDYGGFGEIMTFGCSMYGITPNEMLALFVSRTRNGKKVELLESISSELETKEQVQVPNNIERYFHENNRELEQAAQPYRSKRGLNEGVRDLERLAKARYHCWEEVGEGMWVFDPDSNLWYSLGGKLEIPSMGEVLSGRVERVRHNLIPYDISLLSRSPILFHVHPEELDTFITPDRESLSHPELRDDITKFLTATPSRADYRIIAELIKESSQQIEPRSFIAHAIGLTELIYPQDVQQLEEMGKNSRDIRDQVMLNFDLEGYLFRNRGRVNRYDLAQSLLKDLNKILPKDFEIRLHPAGTQL
jgi:hypothetical protein